MSTELIPTGDSAIRHLLNLFARKTKAPPAEPVLISEPEAPDPPIIRHELCRNEEARMYLDVNPGVGYAVVVAVKWPGKVQPWLSFREMQKIIRQMDDIITRQTVRESNDIFNRAAYPDHEHEHEHD